MFASMVPQKCCKMWENYL